MPNENSLKIETEPYKKKTGSQISSFIKMTFNFQESAILLVFIIFCVILAIVSPRFLAPQNISNVIRQFSMIAIVAVGMTFVIISGGIDLSVGGIVAFVGVSTAWMIVNMGLPIWVAIIVALILGSLLGLVNAILVVKVGLPPFIATLGTMQISRGLVLALTKGYPIRPLPENFLRIGHGKIGVIPIPIIIMVVVVLIAHIYLSRTTNGRYVYYTGSNLEAAVLSGIKTKRVLSSVYVITGLLCAVAAVVLTARLSSAQSNMAEGWELDAIAAVVIGGASLSGGVGSVIGTLIGAAIMGVIRNAMVLLHVSVYWQTVVIGCVILAAVTIDKIRHRK